MAARDEPEEHQKAVQDTLTAVHDLSSPAAGVVAEPDKPPDRSLTETIDALSDVFGMASPAERVAALFLPEHRHIILTPPPSRSLVEHALAFIRDRRRFFTPQDAPGDEQLHAVGFQRNARTEGLFQLVLANGIDYPTQEWSFDFVCHKLVRFVWRFAVDCPLVGDAVAVGGGWVPETVGGGVDDNGAPRPTKQIEVARVNAGSELDVGALLELRPPAAGHTRLFHGCTVYGATSILNDGISASELRNDGDFGKSFYTTPEPSCAVHFMHESRQLLGPFDGAIIVFDVDTARYDALASVPWIEVGAHAGDPEPWEQVVRGFRSGDVNRHMPPSLLQDTRLAQKLCGPIVSYEHELRGTGRITTAPGAGAPPWTQVAFPAACDHPPPGMWFIDWLDTAHTGVHDIHVVRISFP